ncbi:MAG: hypothetical protein F7C38_03330 [Desulfurococcales archaeon]|nr:hypothetical protein [Desulfurococcales archaeon]
MKNCYNVGLVIESSEPTIIPAILDTINRKLSTTCENNVRGSSWSLHACSTTLISVSALIPEIKTLSQASLTIVVAIHSNDPRLLASIVGLLKTMLDEDFPGQAYIRLST